MGGWKSCSSVLGSSWIWWSSLLLFLTLIFSLIASCSPFSFIWSSYTYLGVRGTRVMILPYFIMVYLFLTPLWIVFLLYCYGLLNKMWLACIGTTSCKTSSTYFTIKNGTTTCLVTFTSPLSFSHCNLYGLTCLSIHKFSLLTKGVLQVLTQLLLSIIKLHPVLYIATRMKDVLPLLISFIFLDLNLKCLSYNHRILNR